MGHSSPASPTIPALSVVMPAYNAADYLQEAVRSIVTQKFQDFEFVILDDRSTDATPGILADWAGRDSRIRIITNRERMGVVGSANRVMREARASICARMDADDISHPDRLRRQWEVLRTHDAACMVGALADAIDARGRIVRPRDRSVLLRGGSTPPFPHGSVMFRRTAFEAVGGYREACAYWEDRDLFLRMAQRGRILVLPAALYQLRCHTKSIRLDISPRRLREAFALMQRCLALYGAGQDYTPLLEGRGALSPADSEITVEWLNTWGHLRIWAGLAPGIRHHLRSADGYRPGGASLQILALATLGELSPPLYRLMLRSIYRIRDWRVGARIDELRPVEWRPA